MGRFSKVERQHIPVGIVQLIQRVCSVWTASKVVFIKTIVTRCILLLEEASVTVETQKRGKLALFVWITSLEEQVLQKRAYIAH